MANHRPRRVAELIKKEISQMLLHDEIKDPRIGFVTITDVEVSGDLRHAKVFVSVYDKDPKVKEDTMEGLENAVGYVRRELGQRIRLRHTPEILFRYDDSIKRGTRIFKILEDLDQENEE
ncbi:MULTISPECIES: 30S ribosome-binding factor RbfA [unclassified Candidatus Frackibacter]|uniref:30S ribosome-binding factor RbfA n=1 Tax=unclassified Candidatus Frackibacter TaxID=2648818 RepID=UPI00079A774D|nr:MULTISPECIES: 30S ribosome-binding factor RbfA [unclassified Candidatus Frackibacter]KXS41592.1 MAG: ribosome-binding factor A [Candidatus Frackibacter sp. T328-2]SDB98498.1 ribosome-binding factor A [Candidatus Frackibacter sp. WG11]SEM30254.1 ribosome-binding factor A [Candidatus Frackibacter sp. WG12]SFL35233.1 ribosome-binding factor A [Candidatus Frackibacter sp. WG13]